MIGDFIVNNITYLCEWSLFVFLIGSLFLFCYLRALLIRKFRIALYSLHMKECGERYVSSFQILMNTIGSSTVGMSNITGVAITLCVGGLGAIFCWYGYQVFESILAIM